MPKKDWLGCGLSLLTMLLINFVLQNKFIILKYARKF